MEQLKQKVTAVTNTVTLKAKEYAGRLYSTASPLVQDVFQRVVSADRKKMLRGAIVVVILAVLGVSAFYLLNWLKYKNESPTFSSIRKSELAGSGTIGSEVYAGDVRMTLVGVSEGSYRPLELDEQGKRITREYLAAQVMIFNTGYSEKDVLVFGLEDGKGGQYERQVGVDFYVKDLKEFGPAKEIYPRTIREGTLFFERPDPSIKGLKFIILDETTNKRVEFEVVR